MPGLIAFVQCFKLVDRVRRQNADIELEESSRTKLMGGGTTTMVYAREHRNGTLIAVSNESNSQFVWTVTAVSQ